MAVSLHKSFPQKAEYGTMCTNFCQVLLIVNTDFVNIWRHNLF
jgi:hypothetical protein